MPAPRSNMGRKKRKKPLVDEEDINDTDIEDIDMNAVTDSDEEYTETDRKLLEKVRQRRTSENFDSEDEVYALRDGSEEEGAEEEQDNQQDSMGSDIEELQEDDYDIPDDRAWGNKARNFYSSDYKYTDYSSATRKDLANAEMEEQEAKKLHTRLADENFDIIDSRFIESVKDSENDSGQIVELSKLSKKQRQAFEQKESSAFVALVTDFKERMKEVKEILIPFLKLVENGTCPDCDAVAFVRTKYHIVLNYCVNISFYLMLKAKGSAIHSHPVIARLEQYRQLLAQLQSGQGDLLEQVAEVLKAVKEDKPLYNISDGSQKPSQRASKEKKILGLANLSKKLAHRKKMEIDEQEELPPNIIGSMDEEEEEEEYTDEKNLNTEEKYDGEDKADQKDSVDPLDAEEKRAITYQIAKNKGLMPYRKKELRNPRVKHRIKYRKAKIRRKGAVREVRKELTRYAGEISGIKAGVVKSIKLK